MPAHHFNTNQRVPLLVLIFACLFATGASASGDPFVGRFNGDIDGKQHELLMFSDSPGHYDGELHGAGKRLPVLGRRHGELLLGKIGLSDQGFAFRARLVGNVLLIERQQKQSLKFFRVSE